MPLSSSLLYGLETIVFLNQKLVISARLASQGALRTLQSPGLQINFVSSACFEG